MLKLWKVPASHEELFIERYERLLSWSQKLTGGDQQRAEDVVHDTFVQFILRRPSLNTIENLDGYLYAMLKNTHLSQARRASQDPNRHLSLVEYDSAEIGLRAIDPHTQVQVQEELHRICAYATLRKETSKAGSVLILRFFHGYYPSEIASVTRTTRTAVDKWLQIARAEARLYINNPACLTFMRDSQVRELSGIDFGLSATGFLNELREEIFRSRRSECLRAEEIREKYRAAEAGSLDCDHLAHIVSCAQCLNLINHLLGLPLLSQRSPSDTLGSKSRPKSGPPGGGSSGAVSGDGPATKCLRRVKETIEHKPKELRIAANGYFLASHKIRSELSEQDLSLNVGEPIGFVEVFSEQGIRLILFEIEPPPEGAFDQTALVKFGDGRSLETKVSFNNPWPTLRLVYADPTFTEAESLNLAALETEANDLASAGPATDDNSGGNARRRLLLFVIWLKALVASRLWLRPATVTTLFALTLIASLLLYLHSSTPIVPSAELLSQAIRAEEIIAGKKDQVLHRSINLEERLVDCQLAIVDCRLSSSASPPTGKLIAQHRIEVWQSAEKGITARRLYDERGALVAGDWIRRDGEKQPVLGNVDGSRTIYRAHHAAPEPESTIGKRQSAIGNMEVWQLSPSAKEISQLIGNTQNARVQELSNTYVIRYEVTAALQVTVVLSRDDLHASEMTLVIESQESENRSQKSEGSSEPRLSANRQWREYRFVETSFERRPVSAVAPAVFEPDAILLGGAGTSGRGNTKISSPPPFAITPTPVVATAALEVEVLRLLNEAKADLGEQVTVTRTPGGPVQIQAMVETEARKTEIVRALSSVTGNPAVKVEVETVAEALKRQPQTKSSSGPVVIQRIESANNENPIQEELHRYFAAKDENRTNEQVRRFADEMVGDSQQAMRHAWALKRLLSQFSPEDIRTLSPEARGKWLALIHAHARAFEQGARRLREKLAPILFPSSSSSDAPDEIRISDDAELARAVDQLFTLASANDAAIRSAFAFSTGSASADAVKTPRFWQSLRAAESLAGIIVSSQ